MSELDIMNALKDEEYRMNLTEEQRQQLPENVAGVFELRDEDLSSVAGGMMQNTKPFASCIQECNYTHATSCI